jgi:lauroyl/myristoyl acyltransferase
MPQLSKLSGYSSRKVIRYKREAYPIAPLFTIGTYIEASHGQKSIKEDVTMKLSSFFQWDPNIHIYRRLGRRMCFYYICLLGNCYYLFKREERAAIQGALGRLFAHKRGEVGMEKLSKLIFQGIFSHYYEKIINAYGSLDTLQRFFWNDIDGDGLRKLAPIIEKGNGVLFVTGHYGGIEYIPFYLAMKGYAVTALGKFSTDRLRDAIFSRAQALGLRIIDGDNKNGVFPAIIKELRQNRIVFTQCDEIDEWKPSRKERLSFLGKAIGVDRTINLIKKRSGAGVVLGLLHRQSLNQYRFVVKTPEELEKRLTSPASSLGGLLIKGLEQFIYAFPQNWYQWKKYAEMREHPIQKRSDVPALNPPVLRPVFN